ncbi:MAG TPA: pyruvate dehydrogenase complex dihydrolipoamide acetyltransferase [Alphaproteobacteria bacterium]|nr:pyruvate dehydrogenase complex dihydrolipoamide acetyltransferase [Alphaproteobacteria bacterium]
MPIKVLMPALSPTMTEGKVARWLKNEGDAVKSGDVLAEIETDKATMEVEAVDEGTLGKIVVPGGTDAVKVNDVIAFILEEGEDKSALAKMNGGGPAPAPAAKAPAPPAATGAPTTPPVTPAATAATSPTHTGERVFASPLARRMAEQAGLDLAALKGSGPQGRVIKADVEAALAGGAPAKRAPAAPAPVAAVAAAPAPAAAAIAGAMPHHVVPHTTMRKVIARRLTEAKQQIPHFYLTIDCEIDALLKLRADLNAKSPDKGEGAFKLSVNDFVIRAAALGLKKVPAANASWADEGVVMYDRVDISVAVAIPGGLITPIIRGAEGKGLQTISTEMKTLAEKARAGKLMPEEYQGGTFSVSNLGMYGIKQFEAVINPPQGCILAVGAGEQRPIVKNGALAIATVMSCTLSVDHRVVDGAIGAEFLATLKKLIEDPITMLL